MKALPAADQVACFLTQLQEIGFLPPGTGAVQVRRLLRVYKANVRAAAGYSPGPYPGRITLLRAAEGSAADAEATPARSPDSDLGWSTLLPAPVELHTVPGDDVTLLAPAHVGE